MNNILLSFVVPVYNRIDFLDKCLNSVLSSNLENYEVILIDDCSTDGSGELCDEYGRKYDFIHVYQNSENKGAGYSKNKGLEKCNGEYVFFLDSDDEINTFELKGVMDIVEKNREVELFCLKAIHIKNGKEEYLEKFLGEGLTKTEQFIKDNTSTVFEILMWECIFRRDFLFKNKIKITNYRDNEDRVFISEVFSKVDNIYMIDKKLYKYNFFMANNSITRVNDESLFFDELSYKRRCETVNMCINNMNKIIDKYSLEKEYCDEFNIVYLNYIEDLIFYNAKKISSCNEKIEYKNHNLFELLKKFSFDEIVESIEYKFVEKIKKYKENNNLYFLPAGKLSNKYTKMIFKYGDYIDGFIDNYKSGEKIEITSYDGILSKNIFSLDEVKNDNNIYLVCCTNPISEVLCNQLLTNGIKNKNILTIKKFDTFNY